MKRINVIVPDELRAELKKKAIDEGTSYSEIVIRLITDYLRGKQC